MAIWKPSESWENTFYLEAMLWEDIKKYIERAIQYSNTNNTTVQIEFNWIRLPKIKQETEIDINYIIDIYFDLIKEKNRLYKESDKWIEEAQLRKKEIIEKQDKLNLLIDNLKNINPKDYEELLHWLCEFQEVADDIKVKYNKKIVLSYFKENWFKENENTWKDFNWENSENFARYLIWQSLDWINRVWAPHQIIHKFVNDWKQKFWKKTEENKKKIQEIKESLA